MAHLRLFAALPLLLVFGSPAPVQWDRKPYTEWSEKEARNLLEESPWCRTQTVTDTTAMFDRGRRLDSGQSRIAEAPAVRFHVRLLSAMPVRQGISRLMELQQAARIPEAMAAQLRAFATADFPDYIVVTVTCESPNATLLLQEANSTLLKLTTVDLSQDTYLLDKGGRRLFLREYQAPRSDGLGARFVFPRIKDGAPVFTVEGGELQFYSELKKELIVGGKAVVLNVRYKLREMLFGGRLEL